MKHINQNTTACPNNQSENWIIIQSSQQSHFRSHRLKVHLFYMFVLKLLFTLQQKQIKVVENH